VLTHRFTEHAKGPARATQSYRLRLLENMKLQSSMSWLGRSFYHRNQSGASVFLPASRSRHRHRSLPQSSSSSRFTAAQARFFDLSQSGDRPHR
jgi:hypothetical protein